MDWLEDDEEFFFLNDFYLTMCKKCDRLHDIDIPCEDCDEDLDYADFEEDEDDL